MKEFKDTKFGLVNTSNEIGDPRCSKFKDLHKGERCFIIGSGPSLKKQDISGLYNENVFVSNWFCLHKDYPNFKNMYYISTAQLFCRINGLPPGAYQKLKKNKNAIFFFEECFELVNDEYDYFPNDRIYYLGLDRSKVIDKGEPILTDMTKPFNVAGTVVCDSILPMIHYMGFKEVYILGCDCNSHLDTNPDYSNAHFYEHHELPKIVGRMIKTYSSGLKPHELNPTYKIFKDFMEKDGINIYNVGINSELNVFKKVNLEDIL